MTDRRLRGCNGRLHTATYTSVTCVTKRQAIETCILRGHSMRCCGSKQRSCIRVDSARIEASSECMLDPTWYTQGWAVRVGLSKVEVSLWHGSRFISPRSCRYVSESYNRFDFTLIDASCKLNGSSGSRVERCPLLTTLVSRRVSLSRKTRSQSLDRNTRETQSSPLCTISFILRCVNVLWCLLYGMRAECLDTLYVPFLFILAMTSHFFRSV